MADDRPEAAAYASPASLMAWSRSAESDTGALAWPGAEPVWGNAQADTAANRIRLMAFGLAFAANLLSLRFLFAGITDPG
jgi:hypothetical protein